MTALVTNRLTVCTVQHQLLKIILNYVNALTLFLGAATPSRPLGYSPHFQAESQSFRFKGSDSAQKYVNCKIQI